jgi:hypothetical protein
MMERGNCGGSSGGGGDSRIRLCNQTEGSHMPKEGIYFWGKSAAEKRARTSHAVVVVVTSGLRKAEPWALQRGVGPKQASKHGDGSL